MTSPRPFDVLVIGAGSGLDLANAAIQRGLKVALVEEGPMGGTCLNRGCIPSKMLIHSADVAETIRSSSKFGITSTITGIDFAAIVKRVSDHVEEESRQIEAAIRRNPHVTLYKTTGQFVGEKMFQAGKDFITAPKIFIVGGTRASIPEIPGLKDVPYLTSTEALRLTAQPKHLAIIGGGYIAAELAHFFGALGTKVTLLVRGSMMLREEDEEIARWFTDAFAKKYAITRQTEAARLTQGNGQIEITLDDGKMITADQLLLATGRTPNADRLNVASTGIKLDPKGYITVNEYLETNVEGIWAFGDIASILPYKHTANHQVRYAVANGLAGRRHPVDYHAIAHAVFSSPQVAGVGATEQELRARRTEYLIGRYEYQDTAMGKALQQNGLVKVLANPKGQILGCHIVGPDAATLIHEVVVAMKTSGTVAAITESVHVHPALPEVVQRAFYRIR